MLKTGKFSSFFAGTLNGKVVTVEQVKKVHPDMSVAAEILKLNHLNVVSVLHSEEDLDYR